MQQFISQTTSDPVFCTEIALLLQSDPCVSIWLVACGARIYSHLIAILEQVILYDQKKGEVKVPIQIALT